MQSRDLERIARSVMAKYHYVYDPSHANKPANGNWRMTGSGWSMNDGIPEAPATQTTTVQPVAQSAAVAVPAQPVHVAPIVQQPAVVQPVVQPAATVVQQPAVVQPVVQQPVVQPVVQQPVQPVVQQKEEPAAQAEPVEEPADDPSGDQPVDGLDKPEQDAGDEKDEGADDFSDLVDDDDLDDEPASEDDDLDDKTGSDDDLEDEPASEDDQDDDDGKEDVDVVEDDEIIDEDFDTDEKGSVDESDADDDLEDEPVPEDDLDDETGTDGDLDADDATSGENASEVPSDIFADENAGQYVDETKFQDNMTALNAFVQQFDASEGAANSVTFKAIAANLDWNDLDELHALDDHLREVGLEGIDQALAFLYFQNKNNGEEKLDEIVGKMP